MAAAESQRHAMGAKPNRSAEATAIRGAHSSRTSNLAIRGLTLALTGPAATDASPRKKPLPSGFG